jgi:phosphatidylserine/phosphatidylglycerophosphate/cardiolipin synthase-like enzyme
LDYGIPTWIDYRPAIAHNKVIIVDGQEVITGSFNFTKAAQEKNAENLVIISDNTIAKKYLVNWESRKYYSIPAGEYKPHHKKKYMYTH